MRYVFDDYDLDTQTCELRRAGQPIPLAPKAYGVFLYLVEHRDRLIPKEELLDQVWPDTYVDDSAVKRTILAVRRAIEERPHAPQRLKTQRGQGYRFTAAVTTYDHAPPSPAAAPLPVSAAAAPAPLVVVRPCAACQHDNGLTARFCGRCGAALDPPVRSVVMRWRWRRCSAQPAGTVCRRRPPLPRRLPSTRLLRCHT